MLRRSFFKSIVAGTMCGSLAAGFDRLRTPKRLYGIADYRETATNKAALLALKLKGGRVLVDGREIEQVFYADTDAGVVLTYDLRGGQVPDGMQDGKIHSAQEFSAALRTQRQERRDKGLPDHIDTPSPSWPYHCLDERGVCYHRLNGNVELYAR